MRSGNPRLLALLVFGLFGDPAAAQEGKDMHLEDAGFIMRPADTPKKLDRLRALPPRKFVGRRQAGARYFIYADPDYCKCAFVGTQQAMNTYRDMVSARGNAPTVPIQPSGDSLQDDMIRDMDTEIGDTSDDDILGVPY